MAPGPAAAEVVERVSAYEPTATEAWAEKGFRIQLRFGLESLELIHDHQLMEQRFSFAAEPGIRLGSIVSVAGTLRYTVLPTGLRWTNTADLGLHLFHGLYLAAGLGYGGVWTLDCSGGSLVNTLRLGWLFPLGQVFSMGPAAQMDWQSSIDCDDGGKSLPNFETANFSWTFGWR